MLKTKVRDFETIRNSLVYYPNNTEEEDEGRIYLFDPSICSVEVIAKFHNWYWPYEVATTQNKVNSCVHYFE